MVKIPESYGTVAKMNAQTQIAMPDNGSQMTAQTMQQVGGNLMNMAIQAEYINQKEQEAFNASQLIDFKTELSRFENQQRVALTELPATDAKAIQTAKNKFITERQKFVDDYSNKYKDNKQVSDLVKRQANAESVDFEYDVGRVISSKMKEYGQNTIYKSIYDINNRLSSGGNINKLSQQLKETLDTGFKAGLIDQQDIIRETEKQKSIIVELQKQYEKTRMANLVADGKMAINPLDSDDRKLGDLAFQNVIQKTSKQGIDPTVASMNFISKTGFVPTEVKGIWSTQLNVGTPQQKLETANNIANLIDSNPRLQNQFNSDDISYAMEIKKRSNAGLPPAQVLEYAEKEISKFQSMDRVAKVKATSEKDFAKKINNEFKSFASDYNPLFSRNPIIEDGLKTTFEQIVRDQFVNNKNATIDGSIEFAKNQMKNEFATTEIGQKKVMRYAPEVFYKQYNNGDTSWIKGQFAGKVAEHTLLPNFDTIDKDYSLVPIASTIATKQPSYYISQKKGNNGRMDIMLDAFNRPVVFTPNIQETEFYKKAQEEYSKGRKNPLTQQEMLAILEDISQSSNFSKAVKLGSKGRFAEISTEPLIDRPIIQKKAVEKTIPLIDKIKNFDYNQPIAEVKKLLVNYGDSIKVYANQYKQSVEKEYANFLSEKDMPKMTSERFVSTINLENINNIEQKQTILKDLNKKLPEIQQKINTVNEFQSNPNPQKEKEISKLNQDIEEYKAIFNRTAQDIELGKRMILENINNAYNYVVNSFTEKEVEAKIKDKINAIKEKPKTIAPTIDKNQTNTKKLNPKLDYTVSLPTIEAEDKAINFLNEFPNIRKLRQKAIEDLATYKVYRFFPSSKTDTSSKFETATFNTMAYLKEINKLEKIDKDLSFILYLDFARQIYKEQSQNTKDKLDPTNYFKPKTKGFQFTDFWSEENLGDI